MRTLTQHRVCVLTALNCTCKSGYNASFYVMYLTMKNTKSKFLKSHRLLTMMPGTMNVSSE
jgi:hypothetical protein